MSQFREVFHEKCIGLVIMVCIILSGFVTAKFLYADEVKESCTVDSTGRFGCGQGPAEKPKEAEVPKVTGSGSIGFYNQYIFRGYEIGKSGLVIQPSLSESYGFFRYILGQRGHQST